MTDPAMVIVASELSDEERTVLEFLSRHSNYTVESMAGMAPLRMIPRRYLPSILESLERKQVLISSVRRKLDVKKVYKMFLGGSPFTEERSYSLTVFGRKVVRELDARCRE